MASSEPASEPGNDKGDGLDRGSYSEISSSLADPGKSATVISALETEDAPSIEGPPSQKPFALKKWILGFVGLSLIICFSLGLGVYFAYDYIRGVIQSTSSTLAFLNQEPPLNLIAFMGNDENIWLVSPDGQDLRQMTKDGRDYRFPTWSPNGAHLAFVGPDEADTTALYIASTHTLKSEIVFRETEAAPFYLYWAPNSANLTFLTQEPAGLAMRLVDIHTPEANRTIAEGAPFYWVWSPHSDRLFMHVGGSRILSNEAYLSLIDNRQDAERVELDLAPGTFQAPVWSTDGEYIFYITADENRREAIYKSAPNLDQHEKIADLTGFAFMVLSPDNRHIAYLQFELGTRVPFGRPYIVGTDGKNSRRLADFLAASLYWSPDGSKLALLGLTRTKEGPTAKVAGLAAPIAQEAQLRWWIYDVEAETLEPLTSFAPTTAFLQTVPFFDQYHLSLRFWSPDSRYFVVTKRENDDGDGSIWVFDVTGQEEAHKIGDGTLAVWSWR